MIEILKIIFEVIVILSIITAITILISALLAIILPSDCNWRNKK